MSSLLCLRFYPGFTHVLQTILKVLQTIFNVLQIIFNVLQIIFNVLRRGAGRKGCRGEGGGGM